MVSGVIQDQLQCQRPKPPDNVCNSEPEVKQMMHLAFTMRRKTNDARCKQQSMPNNTALYTDEQGTDL
jgi:hypothetical protein